MEFSRAVSVYSTLIPGNHRALRCGADLAATFKRSDFGMTVMQSFVGDEVTVIVQAEAVRPSTQK